MCGIIGIAGITPVQERKWLSLGRDSMRHRGPDDAGEWWSANGCVGLGHRRLAILDLSFAAHQPMEDAHGETCIVFNGEIYNFKELRNQLVQKGATFFSKSDTEVILAAYREWGVDCLSHLNGMFAFALYDARRNKLLLARDRAGEKPLFYSHADGTLRFASELKGLLADPAIQRKIDPESLDCYLTFGYIPAERCILRGVQKLPPAHALALDLDTGELRKWRYWQAPEFSSNSSQQVDEITLLDELEGLLEDSVRGQMVADVPVGVLLSGGVDSSLITAMAARASSHVKTFTVSFPGYGKYDESQHARLIADHFATEHIELQAADISVDLLPLLAKQFDEPIVDSSMIPTHIVSQLVRRHCTVSLGGDGGDELFGGYPQYNRLLDLQQKMRYLPLALRRFVAWNAAKFLPVGIKGRNLLQQFGADLDNYLPLHGTYFDSVSRKKILRQLGKLDGCAEQIFKERIPLEADLLQRVTRRDFQDSFAEQILVKVDRTSMLNSLELRAPLLDYRIIEFAFGKVPSSLKVMGGRRKILLKKLAARVLPSEFDKHRKQGFSIPLAFWLRSDPWLSFFKDVLLSSKESIFEQRIILDLFKGQAMGRTNSERLFALVMFELWRREYRACL